MTATPPPPAVHLIDADRHGLAAVLAVLWRSRRLLAAVMFLAVVAALAYWRLAPPVFRAEARFVPASRVLGDNDTAPMGALANAALSLGVNVTGGKADPALLYGDVLKSRTLIQRALQTRVVDGLGDSVVVLDALAIGGRSPAERLAKGERRVRQDVLRTTVDVRTGLINLSIGARDPVVAASLANYFVAQIDTFNLRVRGAGAGRQVSFISERLQEVSATLLAAEKALEQFRSMNRIVGMSPDLRLQEERLERDVRLNEQLYITLRSQLEMSRIEEAKRFPAILTIDRAVPPLYRNSPRLGRTLLVFGLAALALAAVAILLLDYLRSSRNNPVVADMMAELAGDLRRLKSGKLP